MRLTFRQSMPRNSATTGSSGWAPPAGSAVAGVDGPARAAAVEPLIASRARLSGTGPDAMATTCRLGAVSPPTSSTHSTPRPKPERGIRAFAGGELIDHQSWATIRRFPALLCCNCVVAGQLRNGGSDRKVGSPAGRPLQWKAGTAVSAPVPRMTTYRCEGEQVTANVRTFYGPCPQGGRPGARRGPDAQPQLHRHRAHSAGPNPRRRRGSGQVAGVTGHLAGGCPQPGRGDHRPGPAGSVGSLSVHPAREKGPGAEPARGAAARPPLHRHRAHSARSDP